jgi:glucan endo-1,3-alpha-glucosidase
MVLVVLLLFLLFTEPFSLPFHSVLPCNTSANASALRDYVTTFANSTAQFRYQNKILVTTFSGEKCFFGQGSVADGWSTQFVGQLKGQNQVLFVPSFFVDPATFKNYSKAASGQFNVRLPFQ